MRPEKKFLVEEARKQLDASSFALLTDFTKLSVAQGTELRKRLRTVGAEFHVVKNSALKIAFKECGIDSAVAGALTGPTAVITGQRDISATAKVLKTFAAEFEKPKIKLGLMDKAVLQAADVVAIADLPSIEVLRSQLLGLLQMPASQFVRILGAPATKFAQIIKAYEEKKSKEVPAAAPVAEAAKA